MSSLTTDTNVPQFSPPVNTPINTQLPLLPASMTHHSNVLPRYIRCNRDIVWTRTSYYGVSQSRRVLSPALLLKRFDRIRDFLQYTLGMTTAEREVTLRLMRYWAYYGQVYVKESAITAEPGCSKSTYWRTVRKLQELGMLTVIHRYLTPFRRQISNLYRLDKLVLMIAKYLAEHGVPFAEKWLKPYLRLPWPQLWRLNSRPLLPGLSDSFSGVQGY